jgi:hypothetical protein
VSVLLTLAHLAIPGRADLSDAGARCRETSDGLHCTGWQEGVHRCCACGSETEDAPEPGEHDPGPEIDDDGGMSEYRHSGPGDPL